MKQCPNCGAQIADDSRFCSECGKEITQANVCPHCGASVGDGDAFCQNCGKSIKENVVTDPSKKTCPHCGAIMNEGDAFCQNCGKRPTDEVVVADEVVNEEYEEEQPKSGFKKYLPYILGVFVVLCVLGYIGSKKNDSDASANLDNKEVQLTDTIAKDEKKTLESGADYTEEDIKSCIESMYKEIYNSNDNQDFDAKYTSSDYQSLLNEACGVSEDEVGPLDANHWIQGQDCDKPTMSVISVKKESHTKAIAKINIQQFKGNDDQCLVRLILLFEKGKWVVDDFISLWDGGQEHSEKAYLKKYIEDCQTKPKEDYSWLQGHWVYEQSSYKGHFIIQGDKITQYSSMSPERMENTFRIENGAIRARLIDGMDLVVPIDFANHRIDYGDGNWMHKVE